MALQHFPSPTWLVGCGNMGRALVDGWRLADVDLTPVTIVRPSGSPIEGVRTVRSAAEAGPPPKLALLGFKPQHLGEIAPQLAPMLSAQTVVVSMLAGVECASLRARFPGAKAIVRVMPNLPVAVRRGVVALYSDDADESVRAQLSQLFAAFGYAVWTADEPGLAAIGSVAAAGTAYVARFIDALAKAGEARGLSTEVARTVAIETLFGTAWLAAGTGEEMSAIVRRVASPNGTTEAGLAVLDPELGDLLARTIAAAAERGAELAGAART